MEIFKKLSILIGIMVFTFSVIGCSLINENPEKANNEVVAQVNGDKITKEEFTNIYDQVKINYGITEEIENDPEQSKMIKNLKVATLEQMISEKIVLQNAKKAGFMVKDDTLSQAKEEFENLIDNIAEQMRLQDQEGQVDDKSREDENNKDYLKEARDYVNEQLETINMTQDEYIQYIAEQIIIEQFMEQALADIQATGGEIEQYYKEQLENQKTSSSFTGYEVELYIPPERRVKHILIQLPEEEQDEYDRLLIDGKEDEARKYLDDKLKDIEPKALEVLSKIGNGEDFEKLLDEYGQDPGMIDNEEGYLVRQDGQFVPEFEEAVFQLVKDQVSDLVPSRFGYHIIKLYEIRDEKVYTLEEKRDEIAQALENQKKSEAWSSKVTEWLENADIKRYEDRL
ncbi:MAG: peptidylprolyl isomerase [Clostridia bacterium]